jgi:flagella basal body P-ring formation protein FlgA
VRTRWRVFAVPLYIVGGLIGMSGLCAQTAIAAAAAPFAAAEGVQSIQSIRAAAEKFVRDEMPAGSKGLIVSAAELDSRLRLAQCAEPLHAAQVSGSRMQARMPVGVSCKRGAQWTIYVPVSVESEIPVLVLRTPAVRGARIGAQDVAIETRRVSGFPVGYVPDTRALERHTASRPLPAGTVLTTDTLTPDFIVHSGEQVTLLASAGGIEVHAAGRALADGHEGSRIRVQNLNSLKVVEGVVESDRVIRVTP